MLCIIFTKKKLLVGAKGDIPRLLEVNGQTHINLDMRPMEEVLKDQIGVIGQSYLEFAKKNQIDISEGITTSIAFPVDHVNENERNAVREVLKSTSQPNFKFVHEESLAVSFINGLKDDSLASENVAVVEAMDDYVNLCYVVHDPKAETPNVKETGAEGLFENESFEFFPFRDFGQSSGNEKVLNELLVEFSSVGLTIDMKGQMELAHQLLNPNEDHIYTVSRRTDTVGLEAEVQLTLDRYEDLLTSNRQKVGSQLSSELGSKSIQKVVLLGGFLRNQKLQSFFKDELKLNGKLVLADGKTEYDEYAIIVEGLSKRTAKVLEANKLYAEEQERKRLEAEKRAKVNAELQIKDDRDALLEELQRVCIDPNKREDYERMFIPRGAKLGIPDVVLKWNISEVLSRIELAREIGDTESGEEGAEEKADEKPSANGSLAKAAKVESKAESKETPKAKEESKPAPKVVAKPKPVVEKKPEPVKAAPATAVVNKETKGTQVTLRKTAEAPKIEAKAEPKPAPVEETKPAVVETAPAVIEKEEAPAPKTQDGPRRKMSLNDLFVIKGALPDGDFPTKKVSFHAEQEMKVVKLLPTKDMEDPTQRDRFQRLYEKELQYFGEMSEIEESKEGLFYYRPFIERTTLGEFIKKNGLNKKLHLDDLTSADLKFILQVFKEIRELKISHAGLTANNILVLAKRKWNLSKNVEIRVVGFTPEDATQEEMIKQLHHIFAQLLGTDFYKEFREKFQL
ncbi:hypothetical protein [Pontibacter sp. G13]|uniref:SPOR domain-containing protein n=1 Tax=Pontibacter sp. G13 TaxID=3074898 RepID=UPI002889DB79|nr:hypothetical protein [Pontibacter sp. G13]WNJ18232.1 hypothetical protein RJD25_25555 [Pontibacter sp. G13]